MSRQWKRGLLAGVLTAAVLGAVVVTAHASAAETSGKVVRAAKHPVPGHYVVFLHEGAQTLTANAIHRSSRSLASRYGGKLRSVWDYAVHGFSVTSLNDAEAERLARDPRVKQVRQSGTARGTTDQLNPPSWGLDRVDQRNLPLDKKYSYSGTGAGVNVYHTDSGINYDHTDFEGRAVLGADFMGDGRGGRDCHGHGTHTAGTVGGKTYGVAKKVKLYSVRMLGCDNRGPDSAGVDALNWVAKNGVKPAVINASWRFDDAPIGDDALKAVIASGILLVTAAGNEGGDGCAIGPGGRFPEILNVGMTNSDDSKNFQSNYGRCLDLFGPGAGIISASHSSNTGSANFTGTSMAAPHVSGAVALYLEKNPGSTASQLHDYITSTATPDKVTSPGSGSPNKLLFIPQETGPPPGNDFSIAVSPSSLSVKQGSYGSASVSTTLTSGSAEDVALSATGLPTGATATFQPATVKAGEQAKLSIDVAASTAPGSYPVKLTGKATSATHDTTLTLVVTDPSGGNDFSMSLSPESGSVRSGESVTSTVATTVVSGSAESVSLSASGAPSGVTVSFNPSSVTAGNSSTMTVATTSAVPTGEYPITVKGTAASASHQATFTLYVKKVDQPPTPSDGITNGGFETGNLNGWTATGTTGVTAPGRTGSWAAKVGGASGAHSISQTFTVPTGKNSLTIHTQQGGCTSFNEITTIELTDNATGTKRTLQTFYCFNGSFWNQTFGNVSAGKSYTLVIKHSATGGSYVKVDDVALG